MLKPLSELGKAVLAGALFVGFVVLLAKSVGLDLPDGWNYPLAIVGMLFGSLFAREYFYGEPHPFRRRARPR